MTKLGILMPSSSRNSWAINIFTYEYLMKKNENEKAFRYLKRIADFGDCFANYNLAMCEYSGIGALQEKEKLDCLHYASEGGVGKATLYLLKYYADLYKSDINGNNISVERQKITMLYDKLKTQIKNNHDEDLMKQAAKIAAKFL